MTSTYTPIADGAIGDQFTATLFTALADNDDHLKNPPADLYAPATSDSNITTTSTTFVQLTGFSLSVTTQGGKLFVWFSLRANTTAARFDIRLDSVSVTGDNDGLGAVTPASTFGMNTRLLILNVSAGVHTLDLYWRVTTGTGTVYPAGLCQFAAWEIGDIA
jgi:hypothetical protein